MQSIVLKPGKLGKSHNLTDCKDAKTLLQQLWSLYKTRWPDRPVTDQHSVCVCSGNEDGIRGCVWPRLSDECGWISLEPGSEPGDCMIGLLTSILLRARTLQHCQYWILRGSLLHGSGPGAEEESSHFKDFLSEVEFMMTIYFMISYRIEKFHPLTSLKW